MNRAIRLQLAATEDNSDSPSSNGSPAPQATDVKGVGAVHMGGPLGGKAYVSDSEEGSEYSSGDEDVGP